MELTLTLPTPGAANSLGANKNLVIDTTDPVFSAVSPSSSTTVTNANVGYTLSEAIASGTVTFTRTGGTPDASSPHTATLTGSELNSGTRASAALTNAPTLVSGTTYTISFNGTDAAGNTATTVSSTSVAFDNTAPTISSTSPVDNATDVGIAGDITITFSENIAFGTGNIVLVDITGAGTNTIIIDAASPGSQASISGAVLTINPTANLELNNSYAVQIAASAIDDLAGNSYSGITDNTTFNFTTIATTAAFDATSSNGDESTSSAILPVSLNAASPSTVTVDYTVTGTATGSGTDYTLANGTLTFNPGSTTENITIASIVDDALDEVDETVIVTLSNPTNAGLGTNTQHTYTINDNDAAPTVAFNSTTSSGAESVSSANLQVDLSAVSGKDVTIDYTVTGTATGSGTDYTLANGTLTFTAGSGMENISIASIVNDGLDENDETVIVTLSNPSNATLGTNTVHTYTILDDDPLLTTGFVSTSSSGDESVSSTDLAIGLTGQSGRDIMLDYTVTGTATGSGTDYTLASGTLTIPEGSTNDILTLSGIVDDALDEDNETVIVTLSNPVNVILAASNAVHTYTILDNDATPTVAFALATDAQTEDQPSQDVQVSLSAVSGRTVTVDYTVTGTATDGGTDHTTANGTITFNPGDQDFQQQIVGIVDDALDEDNETIILTLSNPTNATLGAQTTHTYTITDNDPTPTVAFTSSSSSGLESVSSANLQVDLSAVSGRDVTVNYTVTGTATGGGTDYTLANGTLTFTAGSSTDNITIASIVDDAILEANETIIVTLSSPSNAILGANAVHTYTITNNDSASITIANLTAAEDDSGLTFVALLDNAVQGGFTVDANTIDGTATIADSDYTAIVGQTLTFAGTAGEGQLFTVNQTSDTKVELDETFIVSLNNLGATSLTIDISDTATGTITNDDSASLAINDVTRAENADGTTSTFTFTVTLTGEVDTGFTVDYGTGDNTAIAGTDYTANTGQLSFAGTNDETQTISVTVSDDAIVESDETFGVQISNVQVSGRNVTISDDMGTGTITNDDSTSVTIADISGDENGSPITVTATLGNAVQGGFTVDVSTTDGTATIADSDYSAVTSQTLTFVGNAGETQTFTVVQLGDSKVETDETLVVSMGAATGSLAGSITTTDTATVTINNDDSTIVTIEDVEVVEADGVANLTATLTNPVQGGFVLNASTVNGTAVFGPDYTGFTDTAVATFAGTVGETQIISISITDDMIGEEIESFTVTLSSVGSTTTGASIDITDTATVTITDDDAPVVTMVSVPADGNYGIGANLDFTVTFTNPANVTGTPSIPITIGTSTVQATLNGAVTNSLTADFRYTVVEGDLDIDGIVVGVAINLNGGTILGNTDIPAILDLNSVGSTANVNVDGIKPIPTITSSVPDPTNAAFDITITFDEAVTGFTVDDIDVGNGTAGDFTATSATVYTARITPTADGGVNVIVPADVAQDAVGNDNDPSNEFFVDYDATNPLR